MEDQPIICQKIQKKIQKKKQKRKKEKKSHIQGKKRKGKEKK